MSRAGLRVLWTADSGDKAGTEAGVSLLSVNMSLKDKIRVPSPD